MLQLPLPTVPDTAVLRLPLPGAVERWRDLYLHGSFQKLLLFIGLALFLWALARLARRQIDRNITDVNRRHTLRKWVGYSLAALLALIAVALFADALTGLGALLALVAAGVAVALQDVLKSVVGWIYLSTRAGVTVGSRIEVGGIRGDVIDIGVLKTTLMEVGNLVYADQATGRLVTLPNAQMLTANVFITTPDAPLIWQELRVRVPYEADWQRAQTILERLGHELHEQAGSQLDPGFRALEQRYAFRYGTLTPIVYVSLAEAGVELTLRFLTHVRNQRGSMDTISRRVLADFAADPRIPFAYPPVRFYRGARMMDDG